MTFQQEFNSWWAPKSPPTRPAPPIGSKAPHTPKLELKEGRPAIVAFLRHCGCPFAEKTYLLLREAAGNHRDVDFIAVSHSDEQSTNTWLKSLPQAGSEPMNVRVVVDDQLEVYSAWGLGPSGWAHVLSPFSMYTVYRMGKDQGIWNRPTESGSRWQTAGTYAVDAKGVVRWGGPGQRADEIPNFEDAVNSMKGNEAKL